MQELGGDHHPQHGGRGPVRGGRPGPTYCVSIALCSNHYYEENIHRNSNCDSCELCKARSSQVKDKCVVDRAPSSTFYITVYAHKAYKKLEVLVEGSNLQNITCMSDTCGGSVQSNIDME